MPSARVPSTIAIVEAFETPRPTSLRVAQAFARDESANVFFCHWHGLRYSGGKVTMFSPVGVTRNGETALQTNTYDQRVDSMFFYGPDSGRLTERDTASRERLAAAGIDTSGDNVFSLVDRMMLEASRRGVVSNALGSSRVWGPKNLQELQLRRYEAASGESVTRPKTYIARPHEFHLVLSTFARQGETCLVKPSVGEGGQGFIIVRPGDRVGQQFGTVVVQRLIPNPLLIKGHKADLRFYVLLRLDDAASRETASTRIGPIFVRRAAAPYYPASYPAEITNTSYLSRLGLPPDVQLLGSVPDLSVSEKACIVAQLDSITRTFVRALFWNLRQDPAGEEFVSSRLLLFGLDALVARTSDGPCVYFLESNLFPMLYRGLPDCDGAIDEMLSREYLPALIGRDIPERCNR